MKLRNLLILIAAIAVTGLSIPDTLHAQDRVELNEAPGMYSVFAGDRTVLSERFGQTGEFITRQVVMATLGDAERFTLKEDPDILINPVFQDSQGNLAHVDNRINLYMAEPVTEQELERWLSVIGFDLGVEQKTWRDGKPARYHTVTLLPPYQNTSIVETANQLLDNHNVDIAFPNLIHQATPHSPHGITDPLYAEQWIHGKIESELAWLFTQGDSDITIGVLDNGVDYNHPNLTDNILRDGQGNVLGGDFTTDDNPTAFPFGDESHGTQVAGLAAAPINGQGMVGAAPQASIVPLKIATGQTGTARPWSVDQTGFVDALQYAINSNIDILVGAWGLQWDNSGGLIDQAFEDAIEDGRNGKGIVIVYGAGNSGSSYSINIVGHRDDVITVGATMPNDQKWEYSSYSSGPLIPFFVDIAAPSGNTGTTPSTLNWSTDISGSNGVSSDDYWHFGGTSAATPLVAGAAALILSLNPDLTHQEVKDLLYDSADKVGGYSYTGFGGKSAELGHGRLNSFEILKPLLPLQLEDHTFTSFSYPPAVTLTGSAHIFGSSTAESGLTITIPAGKVAVLDGSLSRTGSNHATMVVEGTLIMD